MKNSVHEILGAFRADKTRKTTFGNYRIEGDALIYRAQSSEEAKRWHGTDEFSPARKLIGERIKETDGKLVDADGKLVLLESLTAHSNSRGLRIQFFETETVARKATLSDGTKVFFGNTEVLELIGRTISYGNESRNRSETEIQQVMKNSGYLMLPLSEFEKRDFSTFKQVEVGPEYTVSYTGYTKVSWRVTERPMQACVRAYLFTIEGQSYLYDVDRRESKHGRFRPFLQALAGSPKTIADAYESLKPVQVKMAESQSKSVKRMGNMFFIPCAAPDIPTLTDNERLALLASESLLDDNIVTYLLKGASPSKKASEELLEKIPRSQAFGNYAYQCAFKSNGAIYVKGKVESTGRASLNLDDWHLVVPRVSYKGGLK